MKNYADLIYQASNHLLCEEPNIEVLENLIKLLQNFSPMSLPCADPCLILEYTTSTFHPQGLVQTVLRS